MTDQDENDDPGDRVYEALSLARVGNRELVARLDPAQMARALLSIMDWCDAYRPGVFGEPNLARAQDVLGKAELSRIHATWARHLLNGISLVARRGLDYPPRAEDMEDEP